MKINQKNHDIRLIALDMDGTLLDADHRVSDENKKAITEARNKGVEVILSTGRHYSTCNEYAKELGLSSYLITVNGSEIWTASGELVDRQLLDLSLIQLLVDLHKKHNTSVWMISTEKVWRGEVPDNLDAHQWLKFGFDIEDEQVMKLVMDELEINESFELSNSSLTNIEVNAAGINKARAVEKVCHHLGITMDQVMAIGDSLNDIKMIEEAGLGIAMGNAQTDVKDVADWVTSKHTEDGVAKAIRNWVL
ncbi:HAD-IIB family hydrolase [Aquibacillus halophilus]|uniref:HAD-IIB family hydrolase n=1 Tax=Aquibacillus halophilus TaxID=930132 RepID=A0A6A8DLC1_9BACI|nr:Cof-type HAD-IIB family hydrolase [Aquibacillus halophilus]MRH44591.1 HAD-IIB family hydrolase [Aquibacillus halophilus]